MKKTISSLFSNRKFVIIFCLGILLRLLFFFFQADAAGDDGNRYLKTGLNLVEYGVFSQSEAVPPSPTSHDLPIYPLLVSAALSVMPSESSAIYLLGLVNIVSYACFSLMMALCWRWFAPPSVSGGEEWVALTALFLPDTFPYSLFYMPDAIALFLTSVGIFFYLKALFEKSASSFCAAFFFLGLSTLVKPIVLPYSCVLFLIFPFIANIWKLKKILLCFILGGIIFISLLTPWVLRNKKAFGTPGLTTISGTNLYLCNYFYMLEDLNPMKRKQIEASHLEEVEQIYRSPDLISRSNMLGEIAKKEIIAHPLDYLKTMCIRHPRLYVGTGTIAFLRYLGLTDLENALRGEADASKYAKIMASGIQGISWCVLFTFYILVCYGIWKLFVFALHSMKREHRFFTPDVLKFGFIAGSLLLFATIIGPVVATRYRMIMVPFFGLAAGVGGVSLMKTKLWALLWKSEQNDGA